LIKAPKQATPAQPEVDPWELLAVALAELNAAKEQIQWYEMNAAQRTKGAGFLSQLSRHRRNRDRKILRHTLAINDLLNV
jgi:hypothetical protein